MLVIEVEKFTVFFFCAWSVHGQGRGCVKINNMFPCLVVTFSVILARQLIHANDMLIVNRAMFIWMTALILNPIIYSVCSHQYICCYSPWLLLLFFTTNQLLECVLQLSHASTLSSTFVHFIILLKKKKERKKSYKNLSNCQTLVTSVHAKLFILHLHQLNLVSLSLITNSAYSIHF